ncbi:MAG: hypothetical protein KBF21_16885 [Thermoanaerobaculia bacterium]|nr:hypothetical protein [Thermoanaerobaculia bacterium]MBP9825905.1 hypothetical protein [Thermoanaerobaculia bacterium]
MRFASLAVLLLLSLGCGDESPGTPAAESPHVATPSDKAPPGPEPAAPPNPLSGAAAKPVADATTPSLPPAPIAPIAPVAETRRDATPSGTALSAAEQPTLPQAEAKPVVPARSRPEPSPSPAAEAAPDAAPEAGRPKPTEVPAAAPVAEPLAPAAPEPVAAPPSAPRADLPAPPAAAVPEMDLKALEDQLRQTKAIGFMTKLTLKGQVDDLLGRFRDHYRGKTKESMKDLRRAYDLLMMKVLSLIQDADQRLASAIVASREAIWGLLADPVKFETLQG